MYCTVAIWMIGFQHVCFGISVTFDPTIPVFGDSVKIVCKRTSSSTAAITWDLDSSVLTTCDGTTENACIPSPTGHTYRTDVSANVFNLTLASVSLTDCKTYTCTDAVDTGSSDLYIAKYTASDTVLTNPGAYRSGTISVKTGCVFPTSDVTVTWKIVKVNGNVEDIDGTDTTDTTGCSYTCHSQTSGKAISSITHTECSTPTCEEVTYRAIISHSSYSSVTTLDSAKFRIPVDLNISRRSTTSVATTTVISDAFRPDVAFMYGSCYSIGDSLSMTAVYYGAGTVTAVQWYYSANTETNLIVAAATCTVFGSVPAGFPDSSRISYECPSTHSLPSIIFKLTLTGLQADEVDNSWGATFSVSGASSPDIVKSRIPLCIRSTTNVATTTVISDAFRPDVAFMYGGCYSIGGSLTMTAVYTGAGTVTAVQWYYSANTETNLIVAAATCTVFGPVPAGFPDSSRMSYECPSTHSLPSYTFKLTLTGLLQADEVNNSWGATFTISGASSPDIVESRIPLCGSTNTSSSRYITTTSTTTSDATGKSSAAASSHFSITTSPYRAYPTEGGNRNFDIYVIIGICVGSALLIL